VTFNHVYDGDWDPMSTANWSRGRIPTPTSLLAASTTMTLVKTGSEPWVVRIYLQGQLQSALPIQAADPWRSSAAQ